MISPFYNIFCLRYAIHIAHFRMAMQLHPLADAVIRTGSGEIRYFFNAADRTDRQLIIELIDHRHPFYFHKTSFGKPSSNLIHLIVIYKQFKSQCIRKISNIVKKNRFFIFDLPFIGLDDLSADHHLSHFPDNILDRNRRLFEIPSIDHIRVLRSFHRPFEIRLPSILFHARIAAALYTVSAFLFVFPGGFGIFPRSGTGQEFLSGFSFRHPLFRGSSFDCRFRAGCLRRSGADLGYLPCDP